MSVSVRARTRTLALAVTTTALTAVLATTLPAAAAPSTTVDPGTLPTGDMPRIAWIDTDGPDRIVRPGRPDISVGDGRPRLLHARDGYVVEASRSTDGTSSGLRTSQVFVHRTGRTHVIASRAPVGSSLVSSDGRWLVHATVPGDLDRRSVRVQVRRLPGGHVVRTRTFPTTTQVMAAGHRQVVLVRGTDTLRWTPRTDQVRVLARHGSRQPTGADTPLRPVASIGAGEFTTRAGVHEVVRSLDTSRPLWSTAAHEYVLSFSPDDRLVVTVAGIQEWNQEMPWALAGVLRVRSARSGRLVRTFHGHLAYESAAAPVWEDDRTLLIHASGALDPDLDDGLGGYRDPSVVRCTLGGRCETVPVAPSAPLLQRKSN